MQHTLLSATRVASECYKSIHYIFISILKAYLWCTCKDGVPSQCRLVGHTKFIPTCARTDFCIRRRRHFDHGRHKSHYLPSRCDSRRDLSRFHPSSSSYFSPHLQKTTVHQFQPYVTGKAKHTHVQTHARARAHVLHWLIRCGKLPIRSIVLQSSLVGYLT